MSKLEERYRQRKADYEKYKQDAIAYDTRLKDYLARINKSEEVLREKISTLPENIRKMIYETIPDLDSPCTKENAHERLTAWRAVYNKLEQLGLNLLEE